MKAKIVSEQMVHDAKFEQLPRRGDEITVTDEHGHFRYDVLLIEHVVNHGTTDVWVRVKEKEKSQRQRREAQVNELFEAAAKLPGAPRQRNDP